MISYSRNEPRIVLAHDWLTGMRGGEKCLEVLCRRWPGAPLLTLLGKPGSATRVIEHRDLRHSILQALPQVHRYYRYLLPLMPAAVATIRVPPCDLLVSLSHCAIKALRPPAGVPHICYCFTPMRYAWHQQAAYFPRTGPIGLLSPARDLFLSMLRDWDRRSSERVTDFVAISKTTRERILECYGRSSTVIYPPVDTDFFTPAQVGREDYYLAVSAFAPYKRLELAIKACRELGRTLLVIGSGPEEQRLRSLAGGKVHFLGWQPDDVIRDHMRRCRALLFPGEEDFGIVPVEAQACGTQVIAYGRGGATESVIPPGEKAEPTGMLFYEQTEEALMEGIRLFERDRFHFSPLAARRQAMHFGRRRFEQEFFAFVENTLLLAGTARRRAA